MMDVAIVKMSEEHIASLAHIERECFSTPWSDKALADELKNSHGRFFVALCNGKVAGYIGAHNVVGEVYITNVAVSGAFRRQGVATALIKELVKISKDENADFITLEVRESNTSARALYKKQGFEEVGTRKAFYESPRENAVLMTVNLK
jgi:ribosomal-protein-alanine N-acetyltransferase